MSGDHNMYCSANQPKEKDKKTMSDDIHSCSYYCEYPACIKRQRNALRDQLFIDRDVYGDGNVYRGERSKDSSVKTVWVSLTDEEIHDEALKLMRQHKTGYMGIARAVEAMLKERNNA